ncbi:MAG: hypothetical protein PHS44_02000 [Candidatus Dojkabacteria bacterium]|nr:hypothetical protein [Candidatus Dojkabacteria bacterium]
MESDSRIPNTIDRRVPRGWKIIDLSVRGEALRQWVQELVRVKTIRRAIGIMFLQNPKSNVVIVTTHGQEAITAFDPKETGESQLVNDPTPPWESRQPRIGKAVYRALAPTVKTNSGEGDSYSRQLSLEIAHFMQARLPNWLSATISQATIDPNSGSPVSTLSLVNQMFSDEAITRIGLSRITFGSTAGEIRAVGKRIKLKRTGLQEKDASLVLDKAEFGRSCAVLLAVRMLEASRVKILEMIATTRTPKLVLNIHTAYDRKEETGGNPDMEIIIGTRHSMSTDPRIELFFLRYLKARGFNIAATSFYPIPAPDASHPKTSKGPIKAIEGEHDAFGQFSQTAAQYKVSADEFPEDEILQTLGRLRGTTYSNVIHTIANDRGIEANIFQIECTRRLMVNRERRIELAQVLADFSQAFDSGETSLRELNSQYHLDCEEMLQDYFKKSK